MAVNGSFASPLADAQMPIQKFAGLDRFASKALAGVNGWSVALSMFLFLVVYDQCMYR